MTPYERLEWLNRVARHAFNGGTFRVAIYIAEQAMDGRLVEPIATVATRMGLSYNTVDRGLDVLRQAGLLIELEPARQRKGAVFGIPSVPRAGEASTPATARAESPASPGQVTLSASSVPKVGEANDAQRPQDDGLASPTLVSSVPKVGEQQGVQGVSGGGETPTLGPDQGQPTKRGAHLVETLAGLGAATTPEALAEWHALVSGPLIRASSELGQQSALRRLIEQAIAAGNCPRFAREVHPFAVRWLEQRVARPTSQAAEPRQQERTTAEYAQEHRERRLAGRLLSWEQLAIGQGKGHVGADGSWIKGPAPVPAEVGP